jgi:iron(III) transport system permease protein
MVTISAVSFLSNLRNMPLSLMINQFETQMLIECSAIVSVFILFINGIDKIIIYLIKRWRFINNAK